jgi:hypothetical protein
MVVVLAIDREGARGNWLNGSFAIVKKFSAVFASQTMLVKKAQRIV